jgi:hypothetical protein
MEKGRENREFEATSYWNYRPSHPRGYAGDKLFYFLPLLLTGKVAVYRVHGIPNLASLKAVPRTDDAGYCLHRNWKDGIAVRFPVTRKKG